MNKKKILFVISTLNTGGAQKAASNIIMNMPENYEIDVLINDDSPVIFPCRGRVMSLGLKQRADKRSVFYQLRVLAARVKKLKVLKKQYDACVSFLDSANFANIITKTKGCKTVISIRSTITEAATTSRIHRYIIIPMARLFYNRADVIAVVSKGSARDLTDNVGIRPELVRVIYNGYDVREIEKKAEEDIDSNAVRMDADKVYLVNTGRLSEPKCQWNLIKSFKLVHDRMENARLIIVGEGHLKEELKQIAGRCGVEGEVCFTGFMKNPYSIMSRCHLYVCTSQYEGFSNVLTEALLCGLPVVSTDHRYGAREIMAPETDYSHQIKDGMEYTPYGVLVPVSSRHISVEEITHEDELMAEAIIELLSNSTMYETMKSRCKVRGADFAIERSIECWKDIL